MKTIILSAGKGERLLPLTKDRPKILIELGDGTTLLSRQIKNLANQDEIEEAIIGAGYCVDKIEEFIIHSKSKLKIRIVYNPFYSVSGPLVTLWLVLNKIDASDFMFMNGDTIYGDAVFKKIKELTNSSDEGIFLFCSGDCDFSSDDVLVKFGEGKKVYKVGKYLEKADAVSAGLVVVKGDKGSGEFRKMLDRVSRTDDFLNYKKTWHSFLNDLVNGGIGVEPVTVDRSEWAEVDLHFDLKELQNMLKNKITF